jgi:hypothetical protein
MKFRKKPVVIEAERFDPDVRPWPVGVIDLRNEVIQDGWGIETLEGMMLVTPGDWIITGVKGERYPCKPDIFDMTYEAVIVAD